MTLAAGKRVWLRTDRGGNITVHLQPHPHCKGLVRNDFVNTSGERVTEFSSKNGEVLTTFLEVEVLP